MKISKHFNDYELLSPILLRTINERNALPNWYISSKQIDTLEHIRDQVKVPVWVNIAGHSYRGICTDQESIDQGRAVTSQHNRLGAFDITVSDRSPVEIGNIIKSIAHIYGIGGMGVNELSNFVHLDWRNSKKLIKWTY